MSQELVNYDEILAQLAKKATKTEKPSTSSIGVRAGVLSYNGQPVAGNKLDCIIIASTHANLYYEDAFNPNDIKNPVCYAYSEDPDEVEMVPHPKASKPQSDKCSTCPMNQWSSDPKGGRGKACKNTRRLAIIPANTTAEEVPTAELASLALPVMSVNNYSTYVNKLATLFNRPPLAMITTIGTQPDQKSQFKITFDDKGPVDVSLLKPIIDRQAAALKMLEREYDANVEAKEEETKPKGKSKF